VTVPVYNGSYLPPTLLRLASVAVDVNAVMRRSLPDVLVVVEDLSRRVTGRRTIVYSETGTGDTFFVNGGKRFGSLAIDVRVRLGAPSSSGRSATRPTNCTALTCTRRRFR
jgi:hypothetical protein